MADKSKIKPDIEDAEVVDGKPVKDDAVTDGVAKDVADVEAAAPAAAASDPEGVVDTLEGGLVKDEVVILSEASEDDPIVTPDPEPASEFAADPEPEAIDDSPEDEEDIGSSLSTRVLRGLALIFVGIVIALWGAPKLAPLLPAGLAPVAEFLMPGQSEAKAEVAALRAEMETQLAALSNAPQDGVNQEAVDTAIAAYADSQKAELATIKDKLAATDGVEIESRIAALESHIEGVNAELKAVGERLSMQITENGAALSEEAASKLSGYQATLEGLKAQVTDLAAKNGALSQKVDDVAKASARRVEEAQIEASHQVANTATKKLLTDIAAALDSGAPFQTALTGLVEVANVEAPAALSAIADSGTPSWTTLRNGFSDQAHKALRADTTANASEGVVGKFSAFLKTQVGTRSLERKEGDSTDAILSRVEDDLANRRLSAALNEADSLPEAPKTAIADWIANLSALSAAQTALDDLNTALGAT